MRPICLAVAVALLTPVVATPAMAEFFDNVRRTFQTDLPHFFQDDIPCAFGGQPTSHTRTSCTSSRRSADSDIGQDFDRPVVRSDNAPRETTQPFGR